MKVTVCQLHNGRESFAENWLGLIQHLRAEHSELVLLPEMPFASWFPTQREFDAAVWHAAVVAHDTWEPRLSELMPAMALGTRPIDFGNVRYNAGFYWNVEEGITETIHVKSCLASEEGWWEDTWYQRAAPDFEPATIGPVRVGMLIGLEILLPEQAKLYGGGGVHIIAAPRADRISESGAASTRGAWLEAGRNAARASGAYCISSSRGSHADDVGGPGWVIAPDGELMAVTSPDQPFVSVAVDLAVIGEREVSRRADGLGPGGLRLR